MTEMVWEKPVLDGRNYMIKLQRYKSEFKQVWDEFIDNSKNGTFMLKRDYMDYHSDRFQDFSLMFFDDEKLIAIMPASLHNDELQSHGGLTYGGIISDTSMKQHRMLECFDVMKSFLKQKNISKLIYKTIPYIYHKQPSQEDLYALFINGAKLYRRDIASTINLLEPIKMLKGRKAQISRAKRVGVIVEQSNDFKTFIELENNVLREHHSTVAVHNAEELSLLNSKFKQEIQLWIAKHKNKMIAGAVIYVYDNVVHTQYLAADDMAREIGALDLVIKTLIDKFKNENKQYFDFGISTENHGRILNEGLIAQKEGFGGRGVVYDFYEIEL